MLNSDFHFCEHHLFYLSVSPLFKCLFLLLKVSKGLENFFS